METVFESRYKLSEPFPIDQHHQLFVQMSLRAKKMVDAWVAGESVPSTSVREVYDALCDYGQRHFEWEERIMTHMLEFLEDYVQRHGYTPTASLVLQDFSLHVTQHRKEHECFMDIALANYSEDVKYYFIHLFHITYGWFLGHIRKTDAVFSSWYTKLVQDYGYHLPKEFQYTI